MDDLVFNVFFYGCISASIGYAANHQGKKAGLALLVLLLFLLIWAILINLM